MSVSVSVSVSVRGAWCVVRGGVRFVWCTQADGVVEREAKWRLGEKESSACPFIRLGLMRGTKPLQYHLLQQETTEVKAQVRKRPLFVCAMLH